MSMGTVKAFAKIISATLTPQVTVVNALANSPAAGAFIEFEAHHGIGSLVAEVPLSVITATGVPDPTDDIVVEVLTQYYTGAIWDSANDQYSGGSWVNLLPPLRLSLSGTFGTSTPRADLNFESPLRPPIDMIQSLMAQVRDPTNNLITNQKLRHFTSPNTHRHSYSGGITADASAAGKPWEGHADFRVWARHYIAHDPSNTYACNVNIGLV